MVHPSTPYYSGTPFENFGTPLGVQYTRLKSTALDHTAAHVTLECTLHRSPRGYHGAECIKLMKY